MLDLISSYLNHYESWAVDLHAFTFLYVALTTFTKLLPNVFLISIAGARGEFPSPLCVLY